MPRWLIILARDTLTAWGVVFIVMALIAALGDGSVIAPGWIMALGPIAAWVRAELSGWHEKEGHSDG